MSSQGLNRMGEEKVKTQLKERKKGRAFYVEIAELDYARQGGWGGSK